MTARAFEAADMHMAHGGEGPDLLLLLHGMRVLAATGRCLVLAGCEKPDAQAGPAILLLFFLGFSPAARQRARRSLATRSRCFSAAGSSTS